MAKDGGPAFPVPGASWEKGKGMSLRDYFAGQALSAMMGAAENPKQAAFWAYDVADAMLKQREEG